MDERPAAKPAAKPKVKPKPPPKPGIIGPLFSWELLRLARRGQDARARFILAIALFFVLTAFSLIWFRNTSPIELFFGGSQSLTLQESSTFGSSFCLTFLYGQLGILCLLTPAYAAGGIAEEKDKKTLVFLLVSDLTDREIIFGKFFGRTAFLLGVLFAGLPIMAITTLHGGVSNEFLILCYILTGTTVILLSAVSAAAAAQAETFRGGLFRAYGMTALIVLAGCGLGPWISPFAVIVFLYNTEGPDQKVFYTIGVAYPLLQLGATIFGVWMATRAIRRLRARLTRKAPKPPPWVRERYRDEDRDREWHEKQKLKRQEQIEREVGERRRLTEMEQNMIVLEAEETPSAPQPESNDPSAPKRLKARRVQVAASLPPPPPKPSRTTQPKPEPKSSDRRWDSTNERKKKPTGYRDPAMHASKFASPKPKIGTSDPFYWKEKHTTGSVKTEDDEAMKGMMYLVGGVLGLIVLFFFGISLLTLASGNGNDSGRGFARWLLILAGGAGVFAHLLQVGMSACGAICRERHRLTLESLLTIPVTRQAILWPKWLVSLLKGWWWGGPAALVLAFAFFTTDAPIGAIAAVGFSLAAVPFATSFGVWLSIRSSSVNRAIMAFLPVAGFCTIFPIAICSWSSESLWWLWSGLLFFATLLMLGGTFLFWRLSVTAFDSERVLFLRKPSKEE